MKKEVKQVITYDEETGEILKDVTFKEVSQNGRGFVIVFTQKVEELMLECPTAAFKIFMLIALNQQFEEHGYVTTKKAIQEKLGITKQTCLAGFKWLKENFVINEYKINGYTEFMVNPNFVTIGRDKKKRINEWSRRWANSTIQVLDDPTRSAKRQLRKKVPKEKSGRSITMD